MKTTYLCLLITVCLPYVWIVMAKSGPGLDNHRPRDYLAKLTGWRARAHHAQLNSFEIIPAFVAGLMVSYHKHPHPSKIISEICIFFVVLRIIYGLCYIYNAANLRSLAWCLSFICIVSLFFV